MMAAVTAGPKSRPRPVRGSTDTESFISSAGVGMGVGGRRPYKLRQSRDDLLHTGRLPLGSDITTKPMTGDHEAPLAQSFPPARFCADAVRFVVQSRPMFRA